MQVCTGIGFCIGVPQLLSTFNDLCSTVLKNTLEQPSLQNILNPDGRVAFKKPSTQQGQGPVAAIHKHSKDITQSLQILTTKVV